MSRGAVHSVVDATVGARLYSATDVLQALEEGNTVGCSDELVERLNCSMRNVAEAILKTFRDSACINQNSNLNNANMTVRDVMRLHLTCHSPHAQAAQIYSVSKGRTPKMEKGKA
ncbi:hypothetical protein MAP00_003643 [Monascus purpureus]|nr:hypothetical protein MAP00_003643 [Monascus purpureus]